jgi:hypothetical protein
MVRVVFVSISKNVTSNRINGWFFANKEYNCLGFITKKARWTWINVHYLEADGLFLLYVHIQSTKVHFEILADIIGKSCYSHIYSRLGALF